MSLVKSLLQIIPPETSHDLFLRGLSWGLGPTITEKKDLSFVLFRRKIRNRLGVAAGADKNLVAPVGWSRLGFGILEGGTVTTKARKGNPRPRYWKLNNGIAQNMGLPNLGLVNFITNAIKFHNHPNRRALYLGASIASPENIPANLSYLTENLGKYVDYFCLNVSCPNLGFIPDFDEIKKQIRACQGGNYHRCPLFIKVSFMGDKLDDLIKMSCDLGIDGFVAINGLRTEGANFTYSGPDLFPRAVEAVAKIRYLGGEKAIFGVGGIQSGADARAMLEAGADACQIYTGLVMKGPRLVKEILDAF